MKPRFEEHEGQLFRMLDKPEPLTPDAEMPCLVRLIQDDSPMGMFNKWSRNSLTGIKMIVEYLGGRGNMFLRNDHINFCEHLGSHYAGFEIIGYPVAEGSAEWALYQMMQGKKVIHKYTIGNVCCALNQDGNVQYYHMDNLAYIGKIRSKLEFVKKNVAKTGWQLYKEPETAKEPEIVAHKQHATCLMCGKEIKGLLDRHATVSIKRYSISSLYESTYSHYCGKCFLELGFDATERELRNRQQPIAEPEPEPPREPEYVICKRCGGTGYEIKPEPAPKFVVGDWVEFIDAGGRKSQGKCLSNADDRHYAIPVLDTSNMKCIVPTTKIIRKLKPSEVIVHIGCMSGTVRRINDIYFALNPSSKAGRVVPEARIPHAMLDTNTRSLVESLLEAMQEEMGGEK